nr:immunoglobulin heavy chain junction region [Mus musculus]
CARPYYTNYGYFDVW